MLQLSNVEVEEVKKNIGELKKVLVSTKPCPICMVFTELHQKDQRLLRKRRDNLQKFKKMISVSLRALMTLITVIS